MGCVQGKVDSPGRGLERMKAKHDYVKGRRGDGSVSLKQRPVAKLLMLESEAKVSNNFKRAGKKKKIGGDEFSSVWPNWLVENLSPEFLTGLVPRSADSYDKLDKVCEFSSTVFTIYWNSNVAQKIDFRIYLSLCVSGKSLEQVVCFLELKK